MAAIEGRRVDRAVRREERDMSKKPTGYVGSITIQAEAAGIEHQQVQFPERKLDIERLVITNFDRAIDAATRERFGITRFEQIEDENDLDCIVRSTNGDWRMDLVELVPAKLERGGHNSEMGAAAVFNCGETADRMLDLVRAKAKKYAGVNPSPWLVVYATAWQFAPSNHECIVAQHALMDSPPKLGRVTFLWLGVDHSWTMTLHPLDPAERESVLQRDIAQLRAGNTVMADLRGAGIVVDAGKGSVRIPVGRVGDLFSKKS
jgi:hypothetical protein